jgi:hypothetical protein
MCDHAGGILLARERLCTGASTAATSSYAIINNVDEVVKQLSDLAAGVLGMAVDTNAPLMEVRVV